MPKDLLKSMRAYARLMNDSIELLDGILARVPEPVDGATPSQSLLDELEKAKTTVSVRYDKLYDNYCLQSVSDELDEDKEEAHTKIYDEAKAVYKKAMTAVNTVLDANRPVAGSQNVTVQARTPARIIEDLKPSEKLTSTMSLEAMRAWAEQYRNFMDQNAKAFEELGLKTARAYLLKAIDAKLATRLRTMRDDDGNLKVTPETTVDQVIKLLESLYIEAKPLWVQRIDYFKEVQGQNEKFDDFWSRKMMLKDACQLNEGIKADDLDVLEILRGVHSGDA